MTKETFARRLSKARKDSGMTQAELAESVEVDVRSVSNYERGQGFPRPEVLDSLSAVLGRAPAWFFLEDGQEIVHRGEPKPFEPLPAIESMRGQLEQLAGAIRAWNEVEKPESVTECGGDLPKRKRGDATNEPGMFSGRRDRARKQKRDPSSGDAGTQK